MNQLTIQLPDEVSDDDLNRVLELVEQLNGKVLERPRKPDPIAALAALQRIADRGGIPSIPDPSAWQREIRKDKLLYGREE